MLVKDSALHKSCLRGKLLLFDPTSSLHPCRTVRIKRPELQFSFCWFLVFDLSTLSCFANWFWNPSNVLWIPLDLRFQQVFSVLSLWFQTLRARCFQATELCRMCTQRWCPSNASDLCDRIAAGGSEFFGYNTGIRIPSFLTRTIWSEYCKYVKIWCVWFCLNPVFVGISPQELHARLVAHEEKTLLLDVRHGEWWWPEFDNAGKSLIVISLSVPELTTNYWYFQYIFSIRPKSDFYRVIGLALPLLLQLDGSENSFVQATCTLRSDPIAWRGQLAFDGDDPIFWGWRGGPWIWFGESLRESGRVWTCHVIFNHLLYIYIYIE